MKTEEEKYASIKKIKRLCDSNFSVRLTSSKHFKRYRALNYYYRVHTHKDHQRLQASICGGDPWHLEWQPRKDHSSFILQELDTMDFSMHLSTPGIVALIMNEIQSRAELTE